MAVCVQIFYSVGLVCVCGCAHCTCMFTHMCQDVRVQVRGQPPGVNSLFLLSCGSQNWTQVVRLGSKHLLSLSNLSWPFVQSLIPIMSLPSAFAFRLGCAHDGLLDLEWLWTLSQLKHLSGGFSGLFRIWKGFGVSSYLSNQLSLEKTPLPQLIPSCNYATVVSWWD